MLASPSSRSPLTPGDVVATASDHAIYTWAPATRRISIVPRARIWLPASGL